MWLTRQLLQEKTAAAGEYARVLPNDCALGDSAYTGVRFSGPWGVSWRPPAGAQAVLVQTAAGPACVGVVEDGADASLSEGELLLKAQGGASVYLKNNGQVLINGTPVGGA